MISSARRFTVALFALAFGVSTLHAIERAEPFHRGMIISCPGWGPIWGSEAMEASLRELKELGVDSVAIHPYGWVKRDGRVEFKPAAELDFLHRAVGFAAKAGVRLFWKPHLGYWGQFDWRGAIDFGANASSWHRFFEQYEAFILDQARFAAAAEIDLFAVGVELEATTQYEDEWRRIIRRVREVFPGRVVYAANWDKLADVPFWDAVDWIGIHAYFPLSEIESPDVAALSRGWQPHVAKLRELSEEHRKPVFFAEIGYNLAPDAARTPWAYRSEDTPAARELRTRLIEVAIQQTESLDFVTGMYWWKWMPGRTFYRRNFSMRDEDAKEALAGKWIRDPEAEPATGTDR